MTRHVITKLLVCMLQVRFRGATSTMRTQRKLHGSQKPQFQQQPLPEPMDMRKENTETLILNILFVRGG